VGGSRGGRTGDFNRILSLHFNFECRLLLSCTANGLQQLRLGIDGALITVRIDVGESEGGGERGDGMHSRISGIQEGQ
jgi:hypothetical protein